MLKSLLVALQFIRTKSMRLLPERFDAHLRKHVSAMGFNSNRINGLFELDSEGLKREHISHQVQNIEKYTKVIAEKAFFLMTAPVGRSFYISDNPVVLKNDQPRSLLTGGLGIGAPFIQIYLPLSSNVLLCAYDRAVLGKMMKTADETRNREVASYALAKLLAGEISAAQMKAAIDADRDLDPVIAIVKAVNAGQPIAVSPETVQFYNSLQAFYAHRFVIDPDNSFAVAREMIGERNAVSEDEELAANGRL
jgi:hypothetical protein